MEGGYDGAMNVLPAFSLRATGGMNRPIWAMPPSWQGLGLISRARVQIAFRVRREFSCQSNGVMQAPVG
jgi:hypothetical protein